MRLETEFDATVNGTPVVGRTAEFASGSLMEAEWEGPRMPLNSEVDFVVGEQSVRLLVVASPSGESGGHKGVTLKDPLR